MAEEMKENNIKSFSDIPLKLKYKKFKFGWGLKTFLLCLLLSCALCLPSMFLNGGMFTYMGDYNAQQIPFYVHCHQAIREGNIIWDWGTELGTSFLGSYTYYTLCSPFFWFTLLFPTSWVPYLMGPLLMLKFALSGLAAYLYLKNHVKEQRSAFFGGILYAFSGWSVYNVFYNQFHESFIVFPLLLLALDNLVEKKQYGFFALMVAVSAFVNYYFFVGMAVFCVLYWLVRTIMKSWNMSVKKTVIIAVEAILGTLCAMFILLPSAITVFSMDRTAGTIMGWDMLIYPQPKVYLCILQSMFFPAEIPAIQGFIYCKETAWQSLTLYLPFIGMVGVFTWFRNKFKSWQSILLLVCAIFAFVPILNASFTMFQPVYYARWYMMPILIMCLVSVKAAEEFEVQKFKGSFSLISLITLLTVAVFAFCPHIEDGKWVFGLFSRVYPVAPYLFAIWSAIAILQILSTYTLYRKRMQEKLLDNNKVLRYLSLFIVGVCFFTSVFCYGVGDGQRTSSVIKNAKSAYSVMEDENARINIVCGTGEMNYNMLAGRDSVSCFQSLTSDGAIKFYKTMFNFTRTVTAPTLYSQTEAATMLSVRYMYVKKASVDNILKKDENEIDSNTNIELVTDGFNKYGYALNDGFTLIAENDEYCVYENKNYLSYGIPYTQYISEADYQKLSKSEQSEVFLKALVVHESDIDKVSDIMTPYIPDEVKYEDVCTSLKDKTCDTFVKTSNGFNASITVDKPTYIMFSVPYEENAWTATINGQNADIVVVDGGLMAIRVNSGVNNIVFEYETPGFELGAIVSCTAAFLLLIYCAVAYASKKFIKI